MLNNWRIGRPFGIDLYISSWFWLLPIIVFVTSFADGGLGDAATNTAFALAVFVCVALHELGHALAARGYGIRTRDITLYPIGGVARLERMPEKPSAEIVIALAGPAVNVVLAFLLGGVWLAGHSAVESMGTAATWGSDFVGRLALANVVLAVFNMIPAFPMDGGRVLRAFLCWFTNRVTATTIAGVVGAVCAVLIGLFGLGLFGGSFNPLLVFLAVSVFLMGQQEVRMVRVQAEEERRRREWEEGQAGWDDDDPRWDRGGRAGGDGWVYDARTGEWIEYRDGWPTGRFRRY